jgi:hypothetical protein
LAGDPGTPPLSFVNDSESIAAQTSGIKVFGIARLVRELGLLARVCLTFFAVRAQYSI